MIQHWPIIQAMIRCGLANNPTESFKHQVRRYQQRLPSDSKEFDSITDMLSPKNEDRDFRIVQSETYLNFNTGEEITITNSTPEPKVLAQKLLTFLEEEYKAGRVHHYKSIGYAGWKAYELAESDWQSYCKQHSLNSI